MKELITIESQPALFTADFAAAKKSLSRKLKKYNIVVTADTVKGAKELATELNGIANGIGKKGKVAVDEVSVPIVDFKANIKELIALCQTGREDILKQVKVFEDKTREELLLLLDGLRGSLWHDNEVKDEFQAANIAELVILSNITGKGNLTSKAIDTVTARVNEDKQKQTEIAIRLLELENKCFRAGLKVPLERVHVEAFLFADAKDYETRL